MMTKDDVLAPLAALRRSEIVVTTMGMVRPWGRHSSSDLDFASADSAMGHAADLALGLALAQPARKVVCLNGDGSMLMSLGTLAVAAEQQARNFVLFVIQNESYEVTGNQPIPGAARVDFTLLARGSGFTSVHAFDDAADYRAKLPTVLALPGPTLVVVRVEKGNEGPLGRGPQESAAYLKESLADAARRLRAVLTAGS
jgi:thiamine pyrophosphate-dependent acetolactate synthase large subunit-like protein